MGAYGIACRDAPPEAALRGRCSVCAALLTGRKTQWCSKMCRDGWYGDHWWNTARVVAMRRTRGRCVRCGGWAREVDHIEPRNGQGYGAGCWNHQSNLQPLCSSCHITAGIVRRRVAEALRRAGVTALSSGPLPAPEAVPLSLWP